MNTCANISDINHLKRCAALTGHEHGLLVQAAWAHGGTSLLMAPLPAVLRQSRGILCSHCVHGSL